MLYQCERDLAIEYLSSKVAMDRQQFLELPRLQLKAGIQNGLEGMVEAGFNAKGFDLEEAEKPFWKRQFVLAGATIPSLGTKNVRNEIQNLFPSAEIITTANLHKASDHLSYNWIKIDPSHRMEALLNVIQTDTTFQPNTNGRILVFTRDASSVDSTAAFLTEKGVPCVGYHKKLGGIYRRANLERFRKEAGIVMVCTDGMSRGMDVEDVTHVVQCDFASSAVAFVHRIGRTARAGRHGVITSLCTNDDSDLADAIRSCIEADVPIEGAFSRNRSFRKKLNRYGTFVPRGVTPGESETTSVV